MDLQREGAELRADAGGDRSRGDGGTGAGRAQDHAAPRHAGRWRAVVDGSYAWEVPAWVYAQRGQPAARRPPASRVPSGAIAVLLDDGTVIYSRPAAGPLADDVLRAARRRARGRRRPAGDPGEPGAGHARCISTDDPDPILAPALQHARRALLRPRRRRRLLPHRRDAGASPPRSTRALRPHRGPAPAARRRARWSSRTTRTCWRASSGASAPPRTPCARRSRRPRPSADQPYLVVSTGERRALVQEGRGGPFPTQVATGSGKTLVREGGGDASGGSRRPGAGSPWSARRRTRSGRLRTGTTWSRRASGARGWCGSSAGRAWPPSDGSVDHRLRQRRGQRSADGRQTVLQATDGREIVVDGKLVVPPLGHHAAPVRGRAGHPPPEPGQRVRAPRHQPAGVHRAGGEPRLRPPAQRGHREALRHGARGHARLHLLSRVIASGSSPKAR